MRKILLWLLRSSICTDCGVISTKGGSYKKGEFTCLRCFTETRRIQQTREGEPKTVGSKKS